ncbi:DUF4124 domain-containing protein [Chitinilyticum piscinae]|nr:DUF4124 domain-containing protein [Chitinilyticum piscinae]
MHQGIAVILLLFSCYACAEVNKCRKADGALIFTDAACPPGSKAEAFSGNTSVNSVPLPTLTPHASDSATEQPSVQRIPDQRRLRDDADDHAVSDSGSTDWFGQPIYYPVLRPTPRPHPQPRPTPQLRPIPRHR